MNLIKALRLTLNFFMLFVVSYTIAIYLNSQTNFWAVINWLPESIVTIANSFLFSATYFIQPVGVDEQEQFTELLLVWFFSLPLVIPMLIVLYWLASKFLPFHSR